ncbi:MAG TPA: nuclear transport factor 2 family protein [Gemmatimonadaceae bacterium]|nr:nuclear transport factor 2 family protein [Gemmatimonadaceae bacterium]
MTPAQQAAIADTLRRLMAGAYDFAHASGDPVANLMSLYADSGRVVSAASGYITGNRDSLQRELREFWTYVGQNMRHPVWRWDTTYVDVLSPSAAVITGRYDIAHRTPTGDPHVIRGAWTALFERRGGRWVIVQEHLSDAPPGSPAEDSATVDSLLPPMDSAEAAAAARARRGAMPEMHDMPGMGHDSAH